MKSILSEHQQRLNGINKEFGASVWISSLPLKDEGYATTKQLFWDLMQIHYGWELRYLPETCVHGSKLNFQHALYNNTT